MPNVSVGFGSHDLSSFALIRGRIRLPVRGAHLTVSWREGQTALDPARKGNSAWLSAIIETVKDDSPLKTGQVWELSGSHGCRSVWMTVLAVDRKTLSPGPPRRVLAGWHFAVVGAKMDPWGWFPQRLRDRDGGKFVPPLIRHLPDPVLRWSDFLVLRMARQYQELVGSGKRSEALELGLILADALLDAGCEDDTLGERLRAGIVYVLEPTRLAIDPDLYLPIIDLGFGENGS